MKTKLIGICSVLALICGDCTGNPSNTTSLDKKSESRIQDKEARYLNLINELISSNNQLRKNNNQLRKSVEELKEQTKEQQKIIEKYETAEKLKERTEEQQKITEEHETAEKLEKQTKEQQKITEEHETDEDEFFDAKEYTEKVPKLEYNEWIHAAAEGKIETIQSYINKGYDVNTQYNGIIRLEGNPYLFDRSTPVGDFNALTVAAKCNRKEVVKLLLKNGAMINLKDPVSRTALIRACENGNEDIVKTLINNGADVNLATDSEYGMTTPLMEAAANGYTNIVIILIANGADVKAKSSRKYTAIDFAWINEHKEIVEILQKNGAKITSFLKHQLSIKKNATF